MLGGATKLLSGLVPRHRRHLVAVHHLAAFHPNCDACICIIRVGMSLTDIMSSLILDILPNVASWGFHEFVFRDHTVAVDAHGLCLGLHATAFVHVMVDGMPHAGRGLSRTTVCGSARTTRTGATIKIVSRWDAPGAPIKVL